MSSLDIGIAIFTFAIDALRVAVLVTGGEDAWVALLGGIVTMFGGVAPAHVGAAAMMCILFNLMIINTPLTSAGIAAALCAAARLAVELLAAARRAAVREPVAR